MGIIDRKDRIEYPEYTIFVKCDKCSQNMGIFDDFSSKSEEKELLERKSWSKIGRKWLCFNCKEAISE